MTRVSNKRSKSLEGLYTYTCICIIPIDQLLKLTITYVSQYYMISAYIRENVESGKTPFNQRIAQKLTSFIVTLMISLRHFSTIVIREDKGFVYKV